MLNLTDLSKILSVPQVVWRIAIIISVAELIIMLSLELIHHNIQTTIIALIDVFILVLISTPVIYLWIIRPFAYAQKAIQKQLENMAYSDPLTGLPNRRLLVSQLEKLIAECVRHKFHAAVILVDLDGFKAINDSYGHDAGDAVLLTVAQRLRANIRIEDMAARIGGDEFIILLNYLNEDFEVAKKEAKEKAHLIQNALIKNIDFNRDQLRIGASFGIRMLCDKDIGVEAAIREADVSMYHAKQSGKGKVILFGVDMPNKK